jgi:hypothetical protein
LVSLSVVLDCGDVDRAYPHFSSDAGHSQARSAQCVRRIAIASRKPDGQSDADGARRNGSAQRADAYDQYLHCEASPFFGNTDDCEWLDYSFIAITGFTLVARRAGK